MLKVNACFSIVLTSVIFFTGCAKKKCVDPTPTKDTSAVIMPQPTVTPKKDTVIYYNYSSTSFPSLVSVDFRDSLHGFIGGFNGFIGKTSNGGTTWSIVSVPSSGDIYGLNFFDGNLGFAGANNGDVYRTTNGGDSWNPVTTPDNSYNYQDFHFFDANTILAAGGTPSTTGTIIKSTNGGTTWSVVSISSGSIYDLEFLNDQIGFLCGSNGGIFKTTDGGATWTAKKVTITPNPSSSVQLSKIQFVDSNTGYCAGFSAFGSPSTANYILKTIDGGETWNQISSPIPTSSTADVFGSLYLDKNNKPLVVGGNVANDTPTLIRLSNNGTNWETISTPGTPHRFTEATYVDGKAFIVGLTGTVIKASYLTY